MRRVVDRARSKGVADADTVAETVLLGVGVAIAADVLPIRCSIRYPRGLEVGCLTIRGQGLLSLCCAAMALCCGPTVRSNVVYLRMAYKVGAIPCQP